MWFNQNNSNANNLGDCDYSGCTNASACNYDAIHNVEDGSCTYAASGYDCDGVCLDDEDGDGVCDEVDNCPDVYNPNQEDFNADGVGDACDGIGLDEDAIQRKLIKVVDVLGREIDKENKDALLLYIYDDGSVEKKYVIE